MRTVVILSGGLGTRLMPFTGIIPKPLLPIGDKALLEIQIEQFFKYGFDHIILATNYKSHYVERFFGDGSAYGVRLTYSKESVPLGTAGPLSLVSDLLRDPFLVVNGDILTDLDFSGLFDYAIMKDSVMTICTKDIITPSRFGSIQTEEDYIIGVDEKPDIKTTVIAGIYAMKPSVLQYIPIDTFFGMDQLIVSLLSATQKITKFNIPGFWTDIGKLDDYTSAQSIYEKHFKY